MSEKFENVLNLALDLSLAERENTQDLNVGYDEVTNTWELIVKYNGSLEELERMGITVEYLIAGYAILTVPQTLVETIGTIPQIEYVEKPKRYFYEQLKPNDDVCTGLVTRREPFLSGRGVLVAVLDSGIDYTLPYFKNAKGGTRIRYLWDQSLRPTEELREQGFVAPKEFPVGIEFSAEQINLALGTGSEVGQVLQLPSIDVSGHGTAVASILAASMVGDYSGVAPESELIVVKLGEPDLRGFPRTTQIMRGVTYAVLKALELNRPLVINLSFGNNYGAHDGSSLIERFLDNAAEIGRCVICVGTGNEGDAGGHYAGKITDISSVELSVASLERGFSVQLWKNYSDRYRIRLQSPSGEGVELSDGINGGKYAYRVGSTRLYIYIGEPVPYSVNQEIYIEFVPAEGKYIESGIWNFLFKPVEVIVGDIDFYLPSQSVTNGGTRFFMSSPWRTLTIPSTASKVISVGAYNSTFDSYADFSGRGENDFSLIASYGLTKNLKPDIVAPGVDILVPDRFGGFMSVNGTSFAAPFVSGSVALMMEWGIVRGNDLFLYGEKIKAYLRAGSRRLRGEGEYPNGKIGFGALCISESLPI